MWKNYNNYLIILTIYVSLLIINYDYFKNNINDNYKYILILLLIAISLKFLVFSNTEYFTSENITLTKNNTLTNNNLSTTSNNFDITTDILNNPQSQEHKRNITKIKYYGL